MLKYLITQIYFTQHEKRNIELKQVIDKHRNSMFSKIFYLNEKSYGLAGDNVEEIIINKRLVFDDVFEFVKNRKLNGIICISNSDIYFDETLGNISEDLATNPIMYCQLRHDQLPTGEITLLKNELYHEGYSQDAWIYHSNYNNLLMNTSSFHFGVPGCDSAFAYIAKKNGFKLINNPTLIRCIHLHNVDFRTNGRDYYNSNSNATKVRLNKPGTTIKPTEN